MYQHPKSLRIEHFNQDFKNHQILSDNKCILSDNVLSQFSHV